MPRHDPYVEGLLEIETRRQKFHVVWFLAVLKALFGFACLILGITDICWTVFNYVPCDNTKYSGAGKDRCEATLAFLLTYISAPIWGGVLIIVVATFGMAALKKDTLAERGNMNDIYLVLVVVLMLIFLPCVVVIPSLEAYHAEDFFFGYDQNNVFTVYDGMKLYIPVVIAILAALVYALCIGTILVMVCCSPFTVKYTPELYAYGQPPELIDEDKPLPARQYRPPPKREIIVPPPQPGYNERPSDTRYRAPVGPLQPAPSRLVSPRQVQAPYLGPREMSEDQAAVTLGDEESRAMHTSAPSVTNTEYWRRADPGDHYFSGEDQQEMPAKPYVVYQPDLLP